MRLGIYGGTFSPPHKGHFLAANAFAKQMNLDKLLIVPTFIPPHKSTNDATSPEDRLEMCKLAFSGIDIANVSDIEITRKGKSYTYITLEELYDDNTELFFLCGTDMFLTMDTWMNFGRVFELATICYLQRENDAQIKGKLQAKAIEYQTKYFAKTVELDVDATEISSTDIRHLIETGKNCEAVLDKATFSYIIKRGLYT